MSKKICCMFVMMAIAVLIGVDSASAIDISPRAEGSGQLGPLGPLSLASHANEIPQVFVSSLGGNGREFVSVYDGNTFELPNLGNPYADAQIHGLGKSIIDLGLSNTNDGDHMISGLFSGRVAGSVVLTADEDLLANLLHINVNSRRHKGGEGRLQMLPVPETSTTMLVLLVGMCGLTSAAYASGQRRFAFLKEYTISFTSDTNPQRGRCNVRERCTCPIFFVCLLAAVRIRLLPPIAKLFSPSTKTRTEHGPRTCKGTRICWRKVPPVSSKECATQT